MVKLEVGLWGLLLCGACGSSTGGTPPKLDAGAEDGTGSRSPEDTGVQPDGSQAPAIGSYQSGSRLRAHYWDGGDGATMFIDWHDTALDITCQFAADASGTLRCLPVRGSTIAIYTTRFLDDACTQRGVLVAGLPARRVPPYATTTGALCGDEAPIVSVNVIAAEASPSKLGYTQRDTRCLPFDLSSDEAMFAITPIEPSIFLPAHTAIERRGPRLDVEVVVADDGARQLGRMLDHDRGASCAPLSGVPPLAITPSVAGATCLPAVVGLPAEVSLRTDCTDATMGGWDCPQRDGCNQTSFAIVATASISNCTTTYDVIALATEAASTYESATGPCSNLTYGSCKFYPQSALVDWSTFPALARGGLGTGRLSRNVLVAEGDGRVLGESKLGFWDGERSANCQPRSFSDQIVRCLPEGTAVIGGFFADAACTQPLIAADDCGHAPPLAAEPYEVGSTLYPNITGQVFAVGDAFRAPTFYRLDPTGCLELPHGDTNRFWIVGAELDRDILPRLTERIDP